MGLDHYEASAFYLRVLEGLNFLSLAIQSRSLPQRTFNSQTVCQPRWRELHPSSGGDAGATRR